MPRAIKKTVAKKVRKTVLAKETPKETPLSELSKKERMARQQGQAK